MDKLKLMTLMSNAHHVYKWKSNVNDRMYDGCDIKPHIEIDGRKHYLDQEVYDYLLHLNDYIQELESYLPEEE